MSLNRIYWNEDLEGSSSENIKVDNILINGDLYYKKKDYNQTGEYLTSYAPGRATFLNLPRITSYEFALVGIEPISYANGDTTLTFNEDAQCVDLNGLITSRSGDNFTINIDKAGIYWVTYKITRIGNQKLVKSVVLKGGVAINGSYGTLPFSDSPIDDESISISFLAVFIVGDKIRIGINVYSNPVGGELVLKPNTIPLPVPPTVTAENSPSFISFLRVGV